jgi:hypothetical protein
MPLIWNLLFFNIHSYNTNTHPFILHHCSSFTIRRGPSFWTEFNADFNPLKKFLKMHQKKVISKNVTEMCTFFTFTHVRQTCFAFNFFLVQLKKIINVF